MKNLLSFRDSALTRSEMKSITGGGCGASCCASGTTACDKMADYGNRTYAEAQAAVTACLSGSGTRAYWCCSSC